MGVQPMSSTTHLKSHSKLLAIAQIHPAITCSELTIETLEQGSVKYVQS